MHGHLNIKKKVCMDTIVFTVRDFHVTLVR